MTTKIPISTGKPRAPFAKHKSRLISWRKQKILNAKNQTINPKRNFKTKNGNRGTGTKYRGGTRWTTESYWAGDFTPWWNKRF